MQSLSALSSGPAGRSLSVGSLCERTLRALAPRRGCVATDGVVDSLFVQFTLIPIIIVNDVYKASRGAARQPDFRQLARSAETGESGPSRLAPVRPDFQESSWEAFQRLALDDQVANELGLTEKMPCSSPGSESSNGFVKKPAKSWVDRSSVMKIRDVGLRTDAPLKLVRAGKSRPSVPFPRSRILTGIITAPSHGRAGVSDRPGGDGRLHAWGPGWPP